MSDLRFHIDAKAISEAFGDLKAQVEQELTQAVQGLAAMTYAKTLEQANKELKTTRKQYTDALSYEEIGPGIWAVTLDKSMLWLEEGQSEFDMRDTLLKKGYKISKDGFKYRSIPFDHGKGPGERNDFQEGLLEKIKQAFKEKNLTISGIEPNANGSPRGVKTASMNIPSPFPSPTASHPALHGLTVFQKTDDKGNVRSNILTFRTISNNPSTEGKWEHPGTPAKKFMDKAFDESVIEWENEILPAIMAKFGGE